MKNHIIIPNKEKHMFPGISVHDPRAVVIAWPTARIQTNAPYVDLKSGKKSILGFYTIQYTEKYLKLRIPYSTQFNN